MIFCIVILELDVAEKQLDQLSIRLDGAVPSDVHNAILLARDQLEEKHKKVANSEARLTTQVKTLQATNERLNQKIESLNSQVSELRGSGTPRPNSDVIFQQLGTTRSEALGNDDCSTRDVVAYMLQAHMDLSSKVKDLSATAPNDDPYFVVSLHPRLEPCVYVCMPCSC